MKHSLAHRSLRVATAQAYDPPLPGPGRFWLERSAPDFSLNAPLGAANAAADATESAERPLHEADSAVVCTNPLREEPSPQAIGAVKRFGLVGLMSVAVGSGIARWWNSFSGRSH